MSGVVDGKNERAYIASTSFSLGDYLKPSPSPDAQFPLLGARLV